MDFSPLGKALMVAGLALVVVGLVVSAGPHLPIGRLPGDLHWKKNGVDVYFPFTTSLLLSALLSIVFWLFRK